MTPPEDPAAKFGTCCKSMTIAMTFPAGRNFFIEDGILRLITAQTELAGGGSAVTAANIKFCPFCGTPLQTDEQIRARLAARRNSS